MRGKEGRCEREGGREGVREGGSEGVRSEGVRGRESVRACFITGLLNMVK